MWNSLFGPTFSGRGLIWGLKVRLQGQTLIFWLKTFYPPSVCHRTRWSRTISGQSARHEHREFMICRDNKTGLGQKSKHWEVKNPTNCPRFGIIKSKFDSLTFVWSHCVTWRGGYGKHNFFSMSTFIWNLLDIWSHSRTTTTWDWSGVFYTFQFQGERGCDSLSLACLHPVASWCELLLWCLQAWSSAPGTRGGSQRGRAPAWCWFPARSLSPAPHLLQQHGIWR